SMAIHAIFAQWSASRPVGAAAAPRSEAVSLKKRPSIIVMKRLDTQGLRLLSQSAGPGTRRAGVRLSASGGLTPHRPAHPTPGAPPPDEWPTDGALAIETPAFIDTSGRVAEQLRRYARALAEENRAKHPESAEQRESAKHAESAQHPESARHPESGIAMKARAR